MTTYYRQKDIPVDLVLWSASWSWPWCWYEPNSKTLKLYRIYLVFTLAQKLANSLERSEDICISSTLRWANGDSLLPGFTDVSAVVLLRVLLLSVCFVWPITLMNLPVYRGPTVWCHLAIRFFWTDVCVPITYLISILSEHIQTFS